MITRTLVYDDGEGGRCEQAEFARISHQICLVADTEWKRSNIHFKILTSHADDTAVPLTLGIDRDGGMVDRSHIREPSAGQFFPK